MANDVVTELPIGSGQARRPAVSPQANNNDDVDEHQAVEQERPVPLLAAVPPAAPIVEELEPVVLWQPHRLERPLQIVVGKTVNWSLRKRTGIETDAGLMSKEHAEAIADPLAEVFNKTPLRALAAKQTEISLGIAIYDYIQDSMHEAARDVLQLEQGARARDVARRQPVDEDDNGFVLPQPMVEGEVPQL